MKLCKRQRKELKKSKWYKRGNQFRVRYVHKGNTLAFMIKEISIASGSGKFSIVVSNPLTKDEKELMGGYYKIILDMGGIVKEPWELKEVDYLGEKQLATITFEIYGR